MDWTSIVLGVLTLIGGLGWMLDRKKHRQEVEALKADNRQKDMNLSKGNTGDGSDPSQKPRQCGGSEGQDRGSGGYRLCGEAR